MGKGQGIAGLVLRIVGVVFGVLSGMLSIIGLPVSIVGLVMVVIGSNKPRVAEQLAGIATTTLALSIIAVMFTTITFFTCGICILCAIGTTTEAGSVPGGLL